MNRIAEERINEIQNSSLMKCLEALEKALPEEVKILLLQAMVHIPHISARQILYSAFQALPEDEDLIQAMGTLKTEEAANLLIARVKNPKSYNRDLMTEQLSKMSFPFIFDVLRSLMDDPNRQVRFQAAHGLFMIGGKEAAFCLCKYVSDPDEWISMTVLKLLSRMREHETIPILQAQYLKEEDIRKKALMVSFLSLFRSVTLVNVFDDGLKSKDARLKANSIEAIAQLELPQREIEYRIMPFITDSNNRIRANAVLAIAKNRSDMARTQITDMVNASDVQLRRSAAYILGNIETEGYEELAIKLLNDHSTDVRKRMVLSLENFPSEFAVEQLKKVVKDPNQWIRKFAIDAAAKYPNFPQELILEQLKRESAQPNIISCMKFFENHPNPEALKNIKIRLKDKREPVVSAAIRAVGAMAGLDGLQEIFPLINVRDPKVLKTFNVLKFSLGDIEYFPQIVEKATSSKNLNQMKLYLPSLTGCLEILTHIDDIPKPLLNKLSMPKEVPVEVPHVVETVKTPSINDNKNLLDKTLQNAPQSQTPPTEILFDFAEKSDLQAAYNETTETSKKFLTAVNLFNKKKFSKAGPMFRSLLKENPDLIQAKLYMGLIAFEERDYSHAREYLLSYLQKNPLDDKAALPLVKIFRVKQEWDNIEKLLRQYMPVLDQFPETVQKKIKRDYGISLYFKRNYDGALELLQGLYNQKVKTPELIFYLAMIYIQRKSFKTAEMLLKEVIEKTPQDHRFNKMAVTSLEKVREMMKIASKTPTPETPKSV